MEDLTGGKKSEAGGAYLREPGKLVAPSHPLVTDDTRPAMVADLGHSISHGRLRAHPDSHETFFHNVGYLFHGPAV